jgi:hypothetical protein
MSRTVWKYSISMYREVVGTFFIPKGATLVHVAPEIINPGSLAEQAVSLWFEVESEADKEPRVFELFGTGHPIPDGAGLYRGTAVVPPLVVHVYERDAIEPTGEESLNV